MMRFNDGFAPGDLTVPALWATRVQATPEAVFLVAQGHTWTYRDFWSEVERLAQQLCSAGGVKPGDRVAAYLSNTPDMLMAWFATLRAGASFAPLNRGQRGTLLTEMLRRVGAAAVLVEPRAEIDEPGVRMLALERGHVLLTGIGSGSVPEAPLLPLEQLPADPYAEAGLIHTSGSTGASKAVALSHTALTHGARRVAQAWQMTRADVYHAWLPHFHIAGQLHQTLATVVAGCRMALFETFSASQFWQQVHESGATIVVGLPNVVNILWQRDANPEVDRSTLRLWVTTAIDPSFHREFEQRFGVQLLDQYGMTEAELLTLPRIGERTPAHSCGRAGPDWELQIVDESDCPVPVGTNGEIVVRPRRPGILMNGYVGDDAAAAAALRNAWFHCGDQGRLDSEGFLYFSGRRKHAIRRRGENISPTELERLISAHPSVAECAVVGVPSPLGEDDVKLAVEAREGHSIDPADLHAWCRCELAKYMVPRYIVVGSLPRTPVGKPDRTLLAQLDGREWDAEVCATVRSA